MPQKYGDLLQGHRLGKDFGLCGTREGGTVFWKLRGVVAFGLTFFVGNE